MSDTRKEVFIQNLKDTTTVLQQLRVCIEAIKETLGYIDDLEQIVKDLDIEAIDSRLNEISVITSNLVNDTDDLKNVNNFINDIHKYRINFKGYYTDDLTTQCSFSTYTVSLLTKEQLLENYETSSLIKRLLKDNMMLFDTNSPYSMEIIAVIDYNDTINLTTKVFTGNVVAVTKSIVGITDFEITELID